MIPDWPASTDAGRPYVLEHADDPAGQAITRLARELEELVRK